MNGTRKKAGFRHPASIPCGMLRGSVRMARVFVWCAPMKDDTDASTIMQLDAHPDLADLQEYDFPLKSMTGSRAVLIAKAWINDDLACFFAEPDSSGRFVLLFKAYQSYLSGLGGEDMRDARIDALYDLTVFVMKDCPPIVDCVRRVRRPRATN